MKFLLVAFLVCIVCSKSLYNPLKSYVTPITQLNFEKQINKIRQTTNYVSIVHFYKYNDGESKQFATSYDEFTNEFRGVFRIGSCDCDESAAICEKEKISKYPTIRIYPPYPVPPLDFEGQLSTEELMKQAARYLHNNIIEVNEANINTFVSENPSVPKALLFTEKKGFPMIYKGLSVEFERKINFGIIRSNETKLIERYNIKAFPKMIVVKTTEKKPQVYNGDLKFQPMFEFLNIFSEVFVPGGGSSSDSAATKHWLTELVPELNQKSANDICLKVEGAICVILLNKGDKPDNNLIDELKKLHNLYERQINRGNVFKFMWLNAEREKKWADMFGFSGETKVVMLNPGRRKRFVAHDGELKLKSIESTLERINGGDAKFARIGDDLPELTFIK